VETATFDERVFDGVQIEGKAFVVYDLKDRKVLAGKNETMELPLASLTKVMTAITAESIASSTNERVTISNENIDGGLDFGLRLGQKWALDELLKYMLVFSSNDAARIVATHFGGMPFFVKEMNEKAKSLTTTLVFTDPAGLDDDSTLGGRGTALDVVILFREALRLFPDILDATTKTRFTASLDSGKVSGIPNTNQTVQDFPGMEGSKTGFTNLAGGNLAVVVDVTLGRPVVIVVLGSTREGRFKDVALLYELLRKSVR
jgi:D-alanyl-D-alanine carboxypeptidase